MIPLQINTEQIEKAIPPISENYLSLLMKGGWIIVPLLLLSLIAIYLIVYKTIALKKLGKKDSSWFTYVMDQIRSGKMEIAAKYSREKEYAYCQVIAEGIESVEKPEDEIQTNMETEARVQVARLESQMNYLGIIASVAPMLGFLGTIFGVIKIFYNISITNDLNIASISDGLYQKMICSGVGLLVGIIAYSGYHILNNQIDKIVLTIDKYSNEVLGALKEYKRFIKIR